MRTTARLNKLATLAFTVCCLLMPGSVWSQQVLLFDTHLGVGSDIIGQTITLTHGRLVIDKILTSDGSALEDGITIDADGDTTTHRKPFTVWKYRYRQNFPHPVTHFAMNPNLIRPA